MAEEYARQHSAVEIERSRADGQPSPPGPRGPRWCHGLSEPPTLTLSADGLCHDGASVRVWLPGKKGRSSCLLPRT